MPIHAPGGAPTPGRRARTRTARTAWNGTLEQGSGQVELTSSGVGTYEVNFPKRAADEVAEIAEASCPVSKALAGTTITLDAGLD